MLVRARVESLFEALCPVCNEWRLLSWFEPLKGDMLSEACRSCRAKPA